MSLPEQPIDRLKSAIMDGNKPLLAALAGNTAALKEVAGLIRNMLDSARADGGLPPLPDVEDLDDVAEVPRTNSTIDFDMESAIKLANKWECEGAKHTDSDGSVRQLRCTDCPTDINVDCLKTYGLLSDAERAIGKTNGADSDTRFSLHRLLRGAASAPAVIKPDVPVERLRRPLVIGSTGIVSRPVPQASGAAAAQVTPPAAPAPAPKKKRPPMSESVRAARAAGLAKARAAKAMKSAPKPAPKPAAKKSAPQAKKKGKR